MKWFAVVFALLFPFAVLAHADSIYFTQDATQAYAFGVMVQHSGFLGGYEVGQPITATWYLGDNVPYVYWVDGCCLRADITFTSTLAVPDNQTYVMYSPFTYEGFISDETGAGWYPVSGIGYGRVALWSGALMEVYVELGAKPPVAAVPEPSSLWLLGSGLIGIAGASSSCS